MLVGRCARSLSRSTFENGMDSYRWNALFFGRKGNAMPNMPNPFAPSLGDKKLSKYDLVQAVRIDIIGELEAIFLYDAHANATDDPVAKAVLADIRDEERAHCGELYALLKYLDPAEAEHLASGEGEVKEMMEKLGIANNASQADAAGGTIGSLKNG